MLKETPRSLRLYFVFIAMISLLPLAAILAGRSAVPLGWSLAPNIAFSLTFAAIAIGFEKLLPKPAPIKIVLSISMVLGLIDFAATLRRGVQVSAVAGLGLEVLIFLYLMKSVTRLSMEVAQKMPNHFPLPTPGAAD